MPVWLDQLALELREAAPGSGARADLARRILSDPRLSLGAQANVDAAALCSEGLTVCGEGRRRGSR